MEKDPSKAIELFEKVIQSESDNNEYKWLVLSLMKCLWWLISPQEFKSFDLFD